jgi:hypothetical protein
MTQVKKAEPSHSIAQSLSKGQMSVNVQLTAYKGHPNPSLLAMLSNGTISMSSLSSGLMLGEFGGD